MKRGSNCIIRTINLADPWTCTRPTALQKLVNLNVKEPCPRFRAAAHSPYVSPRRVAVRVCTWKDMQRVCPRKPCNWKPPVRPTTSGDRLRALLFFAVKGGIVLAILYSIKSTLSWGEIGVYELYYQAMRLLVPAAVEEFKPSDVKESAVRLYNQVVFHTLGMLAAVPLRLEREIRDVLHGRKERRGKTGSSQSKSETGDRGESGET